MNHNPPYSRIGCSGLALLALLFTAGCAVTPETRAKSAPGAIQLAAGEGVVALKVTSNRPIVSTFFAKWATLRVKNVDQQKTFTLSDRSDSSSLHSLFVDNLPRGTYVVQAVGNQASGWLTITESAAAGSRFPSFQINQGQLTHLGTIAYIRKHFPVNSSQFFWGQTDSPFDHEAVLRQLEPNVATRLGRLPILGWNDEAALKERRAAFAEFRSATMRLDSPARLSDGSLLFGESFGQLAIRTRSGEWRWVQTPSALPIRSLYPLENGAILAGSDDGLLMLGGIDGRAWQPLPVPARDASVIHISALPNTDRILVVLQTRDSFAGYSSNLAQPLRWQEEFMGSRALFLNPIMDAQGLVLSVDGRPLLVAGSAEAKLDLVAYDSAQKTWKATQLSEKGLPQAWTSMPGGLLGRFRGIPLTGMYFSTSSDNGVTWDKRGQLNWAQGSLLFVSPKTGYVVRTDSMPALDPEKFVLSLWRTDDAGFTWKTIGPTPAIHGKLLMLGSPDELAYASINGKFFVSTDGGQNWRLERDVP